MRTPPVRPADGLVGWFYESFVPEEDCRCLGLRPLNVSRVKCGADLVATTQCYHVRNIRYAFDAPFYRIAEDLISVCRKYVVAATGPSPFKVGDNQRPERTMYGVENLRLSVPSLAKN